VSPRRRLALAATVSAFVAAIGVVGGVAVGLAPPAGLDGAPPALVVASPGTNGAGTSTTASATTSTKSTGTSSTAPDSTTGSTTPGPVGAKSTGAAMADPGGSFMGSIRDVDLRNFDYPATLCPMVPSHDGAITVRGGFAGITIGGYVPDDASTHGYGAMVEEPVYGDVTGDGIDDGLVHVYCYHVPGDYSVPDPGFDRNLAVVSITPAGPAVVAGFGDAGVSHTVTDENGTRDITYGYAQEARAEGGQLVADWFEAATGGRYKTTVSHRFDGGSFVVVGDTGAFDTWGPTPTSPSSPYGTSIANLDPYRMTLPLSDGRTCGPQFADLGPLADAHLDSGKTYDDGVTHYPSDDVVTADGRATDAQVFVVFAGSEELTAIDGANEVEMIVTVGCRRGGSTTFGQLVLRHAADGPEVIGWVFGPGPVEGAVTTSGWNMAFVDDGDLVVEWYDGSNTMVYAQRLRWDGATFVEVDMGGYCHL
jgi:hypothetical protein